MAGEKAREGRTELQNQTQIMRGKKEKKYQRNEKKGRKKTTQSEIHIYFIFGLHCDADFVLSSHIAHAVPGDGGRVGGTASEQPQCALLPIDLHRLPSLFPPAPVTHPFIHSTVRAEPHNQPNERNEFPQKKKEEKPTTAKTWRRFLRSVAKT